MPTPNAGDPVFPQVFLPKQPDDAVSLSNTTAVGQLERKKFTANSVVAASDEDAKWKFEIPKACLAGFQQNIGDILMVCHYTVA